MTTKLEQAILERVRSEGPIPFAAFMSQALYHPELGYYMSPSPRVGWGGHYVTSPELDPAFGELWANGLAEIWEATGSPDLFEVVEIGPGEGNFAKGVLAAVPPAFAKALRYRLVERSPHARARQQANLAGLANVAWSGSIAEVPKIDQGVVVCNEVLDNLPVHIVEQHGGQIQEVWIGEHQGRLAPTLRSPSTPEVVHFLGRHGVTLSNGVRFEIGLAAEAFVKQVCDLLAWGAVIFIDYGAEIDALTARREGTLVCYSASGTDVDPLGSPGDKDITVFANWTSVRRTLENSQLEPVGPLSQRDILVRLGLAEMDDRLRQEHSRAMVAGKGADAVRALSRRQALGAMADPGGLGGLQVMFGLKEIVAPQFMRVPTDD